MTGVAYCTCSHVGLVMHRVLGLMQQRDQGHASTATAGGGMGIQQSNMHLTIQRAMCVTPVVCWA